MIYNNEYIKERGEWSIIDRKKKIEYSESFEVTLSTYAATPITETKTKLTITFTPSSPTIRNMGMTYTVLFLVLWMNIMTIKIMKEQLDLQRKILLWVKIRCDQHLKIVGYTLSALN